MSVESQRKQRAGSKDKLEIPVWSIGGYYLFSSFSFVAYSSVFISHLSHFSGDVGEKNCKLGARLATIMSSAASIFHGINKKK